MGQRIRLKIRKFVESLPDKLAKWDEESLVPLSGEPEDTLDEIAKRVTKRFWDQAPDEEFPSLLLWEIPRQVKREIYEYKPSFVKRLVEEQGWVLPGYATGEILSNRKCKEVAAFHIKILVDDVLEQEYEKFKAQEKTEDDT